MPFRFAAKENEMLWKCFFGFACLAALSISTALAQHGHPHDGDIEFKYDGSQISVLDGEAGFEDGKAIYERELISGGIDDGYSSFPGFISEVDMGPGFGIPVADTINIEFMQSRFGYFLNYWDPQDGLVKSTDSSIALGFEDESPFTSLTSGGGGGTFVLGQSVAGSPGDTVGDFHRHFDYLLSANSAVGAYAILARLKTDASGIGNSDPFYIVFGYGIDEVQHEAAVERFAGVPEPGSIGLLACAAVAGLARFRRKTV
jgi:hypothetical protein